MVRELQIWNIKFIWQKILKIWCPQEIVADRPTDRSAPMRTPHTTTTTKKERKKKKNERGKRELDMPPPPDKKKKKKKKTKERRKRELDMHSYSLIPKDLKGFQSILQNFTMK